MKVKVTSFKSLTVFLFLWILTDVGVYFDDGKRTCSICRRGEYIWGRCVNVILESCDQMSYYCTSVVGYNCLYTNYCSCDYGYMYDTTAQRCAQPAGYKSNTIECQHIKLNQLLGKQFIYIWICYIITSNVAIWELHFFVRCKFSYSAPYTCTGVNNSIKKLITNIHSPFYRIVDKEVLVCNVKAW